MVPADKEGGDEGGAFLGEVVHVCLVLEEFGRDGERREGSGPIGSNVLALLVEGR